jgi:hypothetical protein
MSKATSGSGQSRSLTRTTGTRSKRDKTSTDVGRTKAAASPRERRKDLGPIDETINLSPPIFIHSSFRSSGTWLWSKLRAAAGTLCYYEIFHEGLGTLDPKRASAVGSSAWNSRHPSGMAPYFLEFLPLLNVGGGVKGFDVEMADRFIPEEGIQGKLSIGERVYISSLIEHAYLNRKVPILADTRTLGRAGAINKTFPGKTLLIHRNLFHQWASWSEQAVTGNLYFIRSLNKFIKASRHDPFLRMLDDWFSDRSEAASDVRMFQVFLLFYLYAYAHAHQAADLVIDVNAIKLDEQFRKSVEGELSEIVGDKIDLSDVEERFEVSMINIADFGEVFDTVNQFVKNIVATCASENDVMFVNHIKNLTFIELDRHEFFVRRYRMFSLASLAEERDRTSDQRAEAARAADLASQSIAALSASRDELAAQLSETKSVQARLSTERDEASSQLAEATVARGTLQQSEMVLRKERDELAELLAGATVRLETLEHSTTELRATGDELSARLAEMKAAQAALSAERDETTGQLGQVIAMCDSLRQSETALRKERDELTELLAGSIATRDALERSAAELNRERQELAERLADTVAVCETLKQSLGARNREPDQLAERLEPDRLETELARVEADRESQQGTAVMPENQDAFVAKNAHRAARNSFLTRLLHLVNLKR